MLKRSAFTMIELVFAIVIIAIAVLALPTMNQITSKGIEGNIVQEAIFAASAQLNQAVSYKWDENSSDDNDSYAQVIWLSDSDCNDTTKLRPGHINQALHRRCRDDKTIRPTYTSDTNDNDLDDQNKTDEQLFSDSASSNAYKKDYTLDVKIDDNATFGGSADENIKKISVAIKSDAKVVTKLETFSSNIGEIDFYHRSY